jgi:photosystem II stability/assembly factor-like uncharacterized protein
MQIFKRRALIGKRTVVHLINFVGKRTVVLLNPSFKNFVYPLCVIRNPFGCSANSNRMKRNLFLFFVLILTKNVTAQWQTIYQDSANFRFKAVYFVNNDTGFVGGWNLPNSNQLGIMYRTFDGGQTWDTTVMDEIIYDIHFVNDSIGFAGGDAGAVFGTSDCGNTWNYKGGIGPGSDITSLFFFDSLNGFRLKVVGEIQRTFDGGVNWQTILQSVGGAYYPGNSRFRFPISNVGYLTEGGYHQGSNTPSIAKTSDSGNTWIDLNIPANFSPYSCFFFDSISGIAVGKAGKISFTNDGGNTWTIPFSIGSYSLYDIYFVTDSIGYAVGGSNIYDNPPNPYAGFIYKTIDRGISWQQMYSTSYNGLNKLSFPSDSIGYAVGMNGNILKIVNANNISSSVQFIPFPNQELSVYPNPAKRIINVTCYKMKDILISNFIGENVLHQTIEGTSVENVQIDISFLPSGIYFIKAGSKVSKFVKE